MEFKVARRAIGVFFMGVAAACAAWQSGLADRHAPNGNAVGYPHGVDLTPDHAQVAAGDTVVVDVLANDSVLGDTPVLMAVAQPDVGSVRMVDGTLVYSAPANARGSTVFHYRAKPRHGGPPRQGEVTIDIGDRLAIRGQVVRAVDQAGPVTVELTVGAQTQTTTAAEDGSYALDFVAFADEPVALLEARGAAGPHPALHLQSYLGSVGRIRRLAGSDGVLERSESNAVTISFLSTAQLVHAHAASGRLPASDAEFEAGVLGSDQASILMTADFLDLVDSGEYWWLPVDTDVLAYISEPGNVTRKWASDGSVGVNYPNPALDLRQVVPARAGAYDGKFVMLQNAVEHATLDGIREVEIHESDANGHRFVDGYARPAIALQPDQDEEGRAIFVPAEDFLVRESVARVSRTATTKQLRYVRERKLITLFDGDQADQVFQQDTIDLVHPDRPYLDRRTFSYTMWVRYDRLPVAPYPTDEVPGRTAFGVYCPRPTLLSGFGHCDYQVHAFNNGGTGVIEAMGAALDGAGQPTTQPAGDAFLWALTSQGTISVRRGAIETRFTRITHENDWASGVIAEGSIQSNGVTKRIAHYQESVRLPAVAPVIAPQDLAGLWQPSVSYHLPLDLFSMQVWTFDFNADGNGSEKITDASLSNNDYRYAWSTTPDAVMLRKYPVAPYYDGDQMVLSNSYCGSADGECQVKFHRWKPLAATNGAYYFVQEVYESSRFPSVPLVRTSVGPVSLHRN